MQTLNTKPILSVIVTTFNSGAYIKNCIDSVLKSNLNNYELIVVDDGSTDNTQQLIQKYKNMNIHVLLFKTNLGPAIRRNQAVASAQSKYIFFLDADTEIDTKCLSEVVRAFDADNHLGAFQGKLINAHTKKLESTGHFLTYFGFPYEIDNEQIHTINNFIFGAKTAAMGIRKDVFEQINGIDQDYLIYGEDTDLTWRVWLSGKTVTFLPTALVYHYQKGTLNKHTEYRIFYEGSKNSTSNLLKNLPLTLLLLLLPLHTFAWLLISIKLLIQKRFFLAWNIYKGLSWNIVHFDRTIAKRATISTYNGNSILTNSIIFGPLTLNDYFKKGWAWFKHV